MSTYQIYTQKNLCHRYKESDMKITITRQNLPTSNNFNYRISRNSSQNQILSDYRIYHQDSSNIPEKKTGRRMVTSNSVNKFKHLDLLSTSNQDDSFNRSFSQKKIITNRKNIESPSSDYRSSKKIFHEIIRKKSLPFDRSVYQERFKIKIDKNAGKPSEETVRLNNRKYLMRTEASYREDDSQPNSSRRYNYSNITRNTVFSSENHESLDRRLNVKKFVNYPHSKSNIGELLNYKFAPDFKNQKLSNKVNKNQFDILKNVEKFPWQK